jgi:wyosine [tRNA(Phe)-imidazoG37] synthetase (radical SAM superfamily)
MSIVFGPIPSRRLGRSLGINNIPPKVCSYSCIYCQIGATDSMSIKRKEYFLSEDIFFEVSEKVKQLQSTGERIDYLTFVPDGEPTLDINLGKTIDLLKPLGIKIAVITNSSLLWDEEVQKDLLKADWVSVKVDTVDEKIWHKIDRPNGKLELEEIISGIKTFASSFKGMLVTETMLVKEMNDNIESLRKTAQVISELNPYKAYILIPTRPPAEIFVEPPSENNLNLAYQTFRDLINNVELLVYSEGTNFSYSSDAEKELLSILAVHPMRKDAVEEFLSRSKTSWSLVDDLIRNNLLKKVKYSNNTFIIKNITR